MNINSREGWLSFVDKIRNSCPVKREEWVNRQPPLISSLEPSDAEDDTNHMEDINMPADRKFGGQIEQ